MKLSNFKMVLKGRMLPLLAMMLFTVVAQAQQFDLESGIDDATQQVGTLTAALKNFVWAISAVVAIYGSFIVFQKFQNGERDTNKAIATWGGAFIFFFAAGFVIDSAFGV